MMNRQQLLRKIETLLDELEKNRAWGTIEIEVRDGVPNMIRRAVNEKLNAQENTRELYSRR